MTDGGKFGVEVESDSTESCLPVEKRGVKKLELRRGVPDKKKFNEEKVS